MLFCSSFGGRAAASRLARRAEAKERAGDRAYEGYYRQPTLPRGRVLMVFPDNHSRNDRRIQSFLPGCKAPWDPLRGTEAGGGQSSSTREAALAILSSQLLALALQVLLDEGDACQLPDSQIPPD